MVRELFSMDIGLIQDFDPLGFQTVSLLDRFNPEFASTHIWIAQAYKDDLFNNIGQSWDNFIKSGQVWALVIGFVLGYLFRSITSS
jgi:hypothetical protein